MELNAHPDIHVIATSPIYESKAMVRDPSKKQPNYLNAVVELDTSLTPEGLLAYTQAIERKLGRENKGGWQPRTIDIDILVYEAEMRQSQDLQIPHPGLGKRRFVLEPWVSLAPTCYIPDPYNKLVSEVLAGCRDSNRPVQIAYDLFAEALAPKN